jgi:RNA recognition motif-containing protein
MRGRSAFSEEIAVVGLPARMSAPGDVSRTIFIRNINYRTTEDELSKALSQYGELASCRIITTFSGGDRVSRGFGFAEFKTAQGFTAATTAKTELTVSDRVLAIRASEPRERRKRDTAFLRGIPQGTTEDQIKTIFAKYNPTEVRLVYFDNADRGKGFAFVKFASEDDQTAAVTDNRTIQLNGGETIVRFARPPNQRRFAFRRGPRPPARAARAPPAEGGERPPRQQRPRRVRRGEEGEKPAPAGN